MTQPSVPQWEWLDFEMVCTLNDEQIEGHGWLDGVRDANALQSALARPQNLAAYGEPDAADLAAAYSFGIARNHPFVDGNKRVAWITARLFLEENGQQMDYREDDAITTMIALAAGELSEEAFAKWLRDRISRA